MANEYSAVCAEHAGRSHDSRSATNLWRGARPSGRTTIAAKQFAESLINDHPVTVRWCRRFNVQPEPPEPNQPTLPALQ